VDWSPYLQKNADAAYLAQSGILHGGSGFTSSTLKMVDTVLQLEVKWGSDSDMPHAWIDLPFEQDGHPWDLSDVSSVDIETSGGGAGGLVVEIMSDVYDSTDAANGLVYLAPLAFPTSSPARQTKPWSAFTVPSSEAPKRNVLLDTVRKRGTSLLLVLTGPSGGGGTTTVRIHKIVLKGTMTRLAK
jgi:hypothetical protein